MMLAPAGSTVIREVGHAPADDYGRSISQALGHNPGLPLWVKRGHAAVSAESRRSVPGINGHALPVPDTRSHASGVAADTARIGRQGRQAVAARDAQFAKSRIDAGARS